MLNQLEAKERLDTLITACRGWRTYYDSMWTLAMALASGNHWSYVANSKTTSREVRRLTEIIDPNRRDCRVTMNVISRNVRRATAASKPQRISANCIPSDGSPGSTLAKHVWDSAMAKRLRAFNGLKVWRDAQYPRFVLGTSVVRRQITQAGKAVNLPPVDELSELGKQPDTLRNLEVSWARGLPFEFLRDPSCDSLGPNENEIIFAQEKPRTLEWIRQNFGVDIQTETTMGQLSNYQDQIRSVTGHKIAAFTSDSKVRGVIVYESYYQDADAEGQWPWQLIGFLDPYNSRENGVTPIHFGRNPFCSLPFHFLTYEERLEMPWGVGMPLLMKQIQDILNLAHTATVRALLNMQDKYLIEDGTVDNIAEALNNRIDMPLIFNRHNNPNKHIPSRLPASSGSPIAQEYIQSMETQAQKAVGMAGVQFGEMVKRGQSGEAYQTNVEQADIPMEDLRKDDELVLNQLLRDTLIDTYRIQYKFRPDLAQEALAAEFPPDMIQQALADDPAKTIQAVVVSPDSLRPRTSREVKEEFSEAVKNQIIPPVQAQREMIDQGGPILDSVMVEAIRKQQLEIEMMLKGQEIVDVAVSEDHATAMWVLKRYMSSPRYYALEDQQKEALVEHWAKHFRADQELQALSQMPLQPPTPGSPSPPAESAAVGQAGTVGPAINVA